MHNRNAKIREVAEMLEDEMELLGKNNYRYGPFEKICCFSQAITGVEDKL